MTPRRNMTVQIFDSLEQMDEAELRRRAEMTPEERIEELARLKNRHPRTNVSLYDPKIIVEPLPDD